MHIVLNKSVLRWKPGFSSRLTHCCPSFPQQLCFVIQEQLLYYLGLTNLFHFHGQPKPGLIYLVPSADEYEQAI